MGVPGGGGRQPSPPPPPVDNNLESFSGKFFLTTPAQSEKVGQIYFRPLIFSFPYANVNMQ
jgi:hypothetical protein